MPGNGVWKLIATAAISIISTGLFFYLSGAKNTLTKDDNLPYPWLYDKEAVYQRLDIQDARTLKLENQYDTIIKELGDIKVLIARSGVNE